MTQTTEKRAASPEEIAVATKKLNALSEELGKIARNKSEGMNIFYAVGMLKQEIKHSAFLAFLLDPEGAHGLGPLFLEKFIDRLFPHADRSDDADVEHKSNRQILQAVGLNSADDLKAFITADDLQVVTEKTIGGNDRRMDIFLESQKTKTVLVIENKVFTSAHDEQLSAYEEKLTDRTGWTKIYIYLTPKGDLPVENGTYYSHWCVFSYASLLNIFADVKKSVKPNTKLQYLTEDYIQMVNTEILLENQEIRKLCKQIRKEHGDALDILLNYTDNAEEVYDYCERWLSERFNIKSSKRTAKSFTFVTAPIADYLHRHGSPVVLDNGFYSVRCGIASKDGPVFLNMAMEKEKDGAWNEAQLAIKRIASPKTAIGNRYHTCFTVPLLSEVERLRSFNDMKPAIDDALEEFALKLSALENALSGL